ncbi:MAG: gamma-glutamyltransferase [Acetobacteraceae bacterium]|nr:gamma-glutamyltransferase [Acetobacteraceae bacterium]
MSSFATAFGRAPDSWINTDPARRMPASGRAAVATANPLASRAALLMLRAGGAAVDAAVAAQAALSVVEPNASGIGGGAMILVHDGDRQLCLDGLARAPARVTARLATDFDGRSVPAERAMYGGRTVGVPGALMALEHAHRRFGRLPWSDLFTPAIELAAEGFPLSPYLWRALQENPAVRDTRFARAQYCDAGVVLPPGTVRRNPALAASLAAIAADGAAALHEGPLAEAIIRATADDPFPGTLTPADLAGYRPVERKPLHFPLGDMMVLAGPLPAYGGLAAAQMIGFLRHHGVAELGATLSADEIHLLAEAGRLAIMDRWPYADPDFAIADIAQLLDPAYLASRAALIDPQRRSNRFPPGRGRELGGSQTSHLCVADARGQVVSMTTTINQNFGSRVEAGGLWLNNVMTNFAAEPVLRGRSGREWRDPNALAPHKRARTTIAPVIVLDATGRPFAALGSGGGFRIIGYVANALLRLAGGMRDPQALLDAPHALNWNGVTEIEPELEHHARALAERGHWPHVRRMDGGTQCLILADGLVHAAGDRRRDGVGMALA